MLAFILFFWKKEKKICILLFSIAAVSFMKHSFLDYLGIEPPGIVKSMSVPI